MRWLAVSVVMGLSTTGAGHRGDEGVFAELWRVAVPGRGTPVVEGRAAYYLTRERDVVALDLPAGAVSWRQPVVRGSRAGVRGAGSRLVVANELVLAGVDDLVAIDRRTGSVVWRSAEIDGHGLGTYAGDVAGPLILCGSAAGRLVGIDWRSGLVMWQQDVAGDGRSTVFAPKADAIGAIAAFTTFGAPAVGGLVAFEPLTGRIIWRRVLPVETTMGSGWAGGPVLAGALAILADATGRIIAVDRATGEIAWTIPHRPDTDRPPTQEFRGLAVADATIFASALDGSVAAYRLADQSRVWRYTDARNGSAGFGLGVDGRWVWCPFIGGLVAIDRRTGREVWRAPAGVAGNAQPPLIHRPYLLAAGAGGLLAFRMGDRS